jgi:7-cyano-7-deazaguanine reductase
MIYEDRKINRQERKAKRTSGEPALPKDIDVSVLATIDYEYPHRKINVELISEEFSCVCPFSGLPDFAKLYINYIPRKKLIELKSLKYYLYAYRNVKIYNEHAVNKILEDLSKAIKPYELTVMAEFSSRGGIKNKVRASYRYPR